jgi:hypothetical protein
MTPYRKKLIEVGLPLAKINEAAARLRGDPATDGTATARRAKA